MVVVLHPNLLWYIHYMKPTELAWLAGILDGEGSFGIHRSSPTLSSKDGQIVAAIQMSTTCPKTHERVKSLLLKIGVKAVTTHRQERDPSKHKDAYYIRIGRLTDVLLLSSELLPYLVTKYEHAKVLKGFASHRLVGYKFDALGRVIRGGKGRRPYTRRDVAYLERARRLNLRGAAAVAAHKQNRMGRPKRADR